MGNKAIIITGANGAIGSFLTAKYLKNGYFVLALIHNHQDRIIPLKEKFPDNLVVKECDLANYEEVKQAFNDFQAEYNFLPAKLIHTSAIRSSDFSPLTETNPQTWYSIVEMNIHSCYNLLHTLLPFLSAEERGKDSLYWL